MKLALLLCWAALPLVGQSTRARLEGRVPSATIPVIDSLVRLAAAEGLPTQPLIQKAIEGGAKHISSDRIVRAVTLNLEQLRQAQALLVRAGDAPPATAVEVTTVASALKRGVPSPVVERLIAALPSEPRSAALHAVADLEVHRFNGDSAADLIITAERQGMRGQRLLDVSGAAIQQLQRGHTHAEALATVRDEIPNVPPASLPLRSGIQGARRPATTAPQP